MRIVENLALWATWNTSTWAPHLGWRVDVIRCLGSGEATQGRPTQGGKPVFLKCPKDDSTKITVKIRSRSRGLDCHVIKSALPPVYLHNLLWTSEYTSVSGFSSFQSTASTIIINRFYWPLFMPATACVKPPFVADTLWPRMGHRSSRKNRAVSWQTLH